MTLTHCWVQGVIITRLVLGETAEAKHLLTHSEAVIEISYQSSCIFPRGPVAAVPTRNVIVVTGTGVPGGIESLERVIHALTVACLSAAGLCVPQAEHQSAERQRARGPGGEYAEACPWADGQGAQAGGGLDGQSGCHRGDLLEVA
jgi:hypothetical protein